MRRSHVAALTSFFFLAVAPACGQAPAAPTPADMELTGVSEWWWVVVLVLVIALSIGYVMRRRRGA